MDLSSVALLCRRLRRAKEDGRGNWHSFERALEEFLLGVQTFLQCQRLVLPVGPDLPLGTAHCFSVAHQLAPS